MIARSHLPVIVMCVLAVALLIQQFALIRTNQALRTEISILTSGPISVGTRLPVLVGVGLDGNRVEYVMARQPTATLVLTLSSGCPGCQRSLKAWNSLAHFAKGLGINTVVVSSDWITTAQEFVSAGNELPGLLIVDPTYATFLGLRLKVTPHAVLVLRSGLIARVWEGAVDSEKEQDIRRALEAL